MQFFKRQIASLVAMTLAWMVGLSPAQGQSMTWTTDEDFDEGTVIAAVWTRGVTSTPAINNPAFAQVIRCQFHRDAVASQYADIVFAHFA